MSPRARRNHALKRPRQGRSRATVDAILTATSRVLVDDGYERATTNRVAVVAGVSVGSLYQYFPSKDALVGAVIERHFDQRLALFSASLEQLQHQELDVVIRAMVKLHVQLRAHDPKLHRVLVEQVPRVGRIAEVQGLDRQMHDRFVAYLQARREWVLPANLPLAVFIGMKSVEAVCHGVLSKETQLCSDAELEDELTALLMRYLSPSAAGK
jgi:AcrR family transcriptional regulator